jgi:tRNA-2-methylthio-N6-dimethylallyladenosine synthase
MYKICLTFVRNLGKSMRNNEESNSGVVDRAEAGPKLFIETYGCQMNVNDSEIVAALMQKNGFSLALKPDHADLIFINTCSIRENAEQRVRGRLDVFRQYKKKNPELIVGVIGCMAERLKEQLLEQDKIVDIVAGPDAYRDLPHLVQMANSGQKAVNVQLSKEETYADINPVKIDSNQVSAFVSIMRGCNNNCAFCVVPFTRGAERSRDPQSILNEIGSLQEKNFKEITLLGQNVNSYRWMPTNNGLDFPDLLGKVATSFPDLRIRFSTSHPKDISEKLLYTIAEHENLCKSIHLPVQSGSSRLLIMMKRGYMREDYMKRIESIRKILPDASISTDIIVGFCSETDEDHRDTLSLMQWVGYDFSFMFKYSERPETLAARKYKDDVPEEIKSARLSEIIELQHKLSFESKKKDIGKIYEVLAEGSSKKSNEELFGRNSQNKVIVFPKGKYNAGDLIKVRVHRHTSATLIGEVLECD